MQNKKNKICFIAPKAYPIFCPTCDKVFGGAEVDLYYIATELAKDPDYDIHFIVADYGQPDQEKIKNVTLIKSLDFNESELNGVRKIWRALKLANCSIYFAEAAHHGHALVALYCKLSKSQFLFRSANTGDLNGSWIKNNGLRGKMFKWSLKQCHTIIAQNISDKIALQNYLGLNSLTISNGSYISKNAIQEKEYVLWVGRSDHIKQPKLFLDIARNIPEENFVMICPHATNDNNFTTLHNEADTISNLKFIPGVPFHKINEYFSKARLLINTSSSEGFPNVFVQACQTATPIISLNVNPDDFLDKYQCGICVNGDLAKCIELSKTFYTSKDYETYCQNAYKYACDNHDINKIINQYKQLFSNII